MRPPETLPGSVNEATATGLAAFKTSDGTRDTTFIHAANLGRVTAEAVSPDGSTLYVAGLFTNIDGQTRGKGAAFNLLLPNYPLLPWNPAVSGTDVRSIAFASNDSSKLYLGGSFSGVSGLPNQRFLARVDSTTGAADTTWHPTIDGPVDALLVAPGNTKLIVGGNFNNANGVAHRAITSVNVAGDGTANGPLGALVAPCGNQSCSKRSDIKTLTTDGTNVFAGAEGTGTGVFDGTFAFDPATGHQVWRDNCLGATQALAVIGGILYDGSHAHDCSAVPGGWGPLPITTGPGSGVVGGAPSWHHLMGESISTGKIQDWFPTTNAGGSTPLGPLEIGPRAMATDGVNLYVGGHFTKGQRRRAAGPDPLHQRRRAGAPDSREQRHGPTASRGQGGHRLFRRQRP